MTTVTGTRGPATTPKVMDFLANNLGVTVSADQMIKDTGLTLTQIQSVMSRLIRDGKVDVQAIVHGRVWVYRGPAVTREPEKASNGKRMFEEIGPARDGSVVIQDDSGKLYKAVEL